MHSPPPPDWACRRRSGKPAAGSSPVPHVCEVPAEQPAPASPRFHGQSVCRSPGHVGAKGRLCTGLGRVQLGVSLQSRTAAKSQPPARLRRGAAADPARPSPALVCTRTRISSFAIGSGFEFNRSHMKRSEINQPSCWVFSMRFLWHKAGSQRRERRGGENTGLGNGGERSNVAFFAAGRLRRFRPQKNFGAAPRPENARALPVAKGRARRRRRSADFAPVSGRASRCQRARGTETRVRGALSPRGRGPAWAGTARPKTRHRKPPAKAALQGGCWPLGQILMPQEAGGGM